MTHKVMDPKLKFAFAAFVVSLLIGMSFMELTGGILLLCFLVALFARKLPLSQAFPEKKLNWGILLWVGLLGIGFALNYREGTYWFHRLAEFRWYLYMCAVLWFLNRSQWSGDLQKWLLIFLVIVSSYGLLTFALQKDLISGQTDYGGVFRIGGPFADPMVFSQSLNFFVCFLWGYFLLSPKKSLKNKLFLAALVLSSANLILTFTRGVWIGFAVALVIGACLRSWRLGIRILLSLMVLAVAAFAIVKPIRDRVLLSLNPETSYDSERWILWKANMQIFSDYPIFGAGYGENRHLLRSYYDRMGLPEGQFEGHAHNQYIHLLAGTGLTGLAMYLFFLFFFFQSTLSVYRKSNSENIKACALGLLLAQMSFVIAGFTEANFEHARVKYVLILCWALVLYILALEKNNSKNQLKN